MQHAENYAASASDDAQYFDGYADVSVHKLMLRDEPRMSFYKSILSSPDIVKGTVVVDVGSGSGILSAWAAQAGALHVISIEASSMASVQLQVMHDNGVADRVSVVHSTVERIVEEGVDAFLTTYPMVRDAGGVNFIVSEWMGFYLFHEGMLQSVLRARDFFQSVNAQIGASGGRVVAPRMIPSSGALYAAPINLSPYREMRYTGQWSNVYGINLSAMGSVEYEEQVEFISPLVDTLPDTCLLHEGVCCWSGSFDTLAGDELVQISAHPAFRFQTSPIFQQRRLEAETVVIDGFTLWFDVKFGASVLTTSPLAAPTHWKQTTILLPREAREVGLVAIPDDADELVLSLSLTASDAAQRCYRIEFELE